MFPNECFNISEVGLYWKKMLNRTSISKEEKSVRGHKVAED
jgi:hypothetical protein